MTHLDRKKKFTDLKSIKLHFFSSEILFAEGMRENNSLADCSSPNVNLSAAPRS